MASRICPQCGKEAPRTAKFCSQCSAPLAGEPTIPRPPQQVELSKQSASASRSKTILISILAMAVVILIALAGFLVNKYSSVVNAPQEAPLSAPPVVQATTPPPIAAPPVTQAPVTPPAPAPAVTQAPTQPATIAPGPPQVIVDYLTFIQQIETNRNNLDASQTAAILPLLTTAQGLKTDDTGDKTTGMNQITNAMTANLAKWQDLIKQFNAQKPPDGCGDLANAYYKYLQDYTDLASQIQVALESGDTAKVMELQGVQNQVNLDANAADSALLAVCNKYNAKKLFVISGDGGSPGSSLLGA